MNDGTIIRKEINWDVYRTNHYEVIIDDIEILRLSADSVDLSYKCSDAGGRIAIRLFYTESTAEFFDGNESFLLNSDHKISIKLFNDDASIARFLVEDEIFTIKEKRLSLCYDKSDALRFELVFIKE